MLSTRELTEGLHWLFALSGDNKDDSQTVSQELVVHHGKRLQVELHPSVKPGRIAGGIETELWEVFGHEVGLVTVLLRDPVQHQLGIDGLLWILQ